MANSARSAKPPPRLAALDALRFSAALAVVAYHYTYSRGADGAVPLTLTTTITRYGFLGVEVFFLISGFVILWSSSGRPALHFARSRFLRLYPEFWIAVLLSTTIFLLRPGGFGEQLTARDVALNMTMVPSYLGSPYVDGIYWTLEVELRFYLLVFLLILARQMRHIEAYLLGWLALTALGTAFEGFDLLRAALVYPYGALFASGGIFYFVYSKGWTLSRALALLMGLVLSCHHTIRSLNDFIYDIHLTADAAVPATCIIVAAFGFFSVLRHITFPRNWATWVSALGALTYPLYLLHNAGKELFLSGQSQPTASLLVGAFVFSIISAWIVMQLSRKLVTPLLRGLFDSVDKPMKHDGT